MRPVWRHRVFAELPQLELILLIGHYAQAWHLGAAAKDGLTATVEPLAQILYAAPSSRAVAFASSFLAQQCLADGSSLV